MMSRNFFDDVDSKTPGYAVAVVKDGKTVLMETAGLADLDKKTPITTKTAFRLASLSKQFTAMAIMILKENQQLNFDDPLKRFIPDFPDYGKFVTIRQLLTHTSGMPDHEKILYRKIQPGDEPTMADALEVIKSQPSPLFQPGSNYKYSDAGYVLLALIIEKVSGLSYREFLQQNIFLPLWMDNSNVLDQEKPKIKNRALGYKIAEGRTERYVPRNDEERFEKFDYDPLNYIVGDEGVYSSIKDMVKWSLAWDEEVLVSRKSLAAAMTPARLTNGKAGKAGYKTAPGKAGFSWLFGKVLNRFRVPPGMTRVIYQDGSWVGFRNIILKIPERKLTVVILSNRTDLDTEGLRISLAYQVAQKFI